jgi:Right handed beta helix region
VLSHARSITTRLRPSIFLLLLLAIIALGYRPPFAQLVPPLAAPPLAAPEVGHAAANGQTVFVPAGGDLQAAIDEAHGGDVIALEAGATFMGNFTLPQKSGADWVVIRSAARESLPPAGVRIAPTDANRLPKIVTPNAAPAIAAQPGAHHFHFIDVEIAAAPNGSARVEALARLESAGGAENDTPADIIFDRCYIHGAPARDVRTGILLASARTAVLDSYLADFQDASAGSQAIAITGPGPFKIVNNYLSAAAENVVLGASDASAASPADVEIRGNYFHKPISWKTGARARQAKNLLALKSGQRVLIENNVFENSWSTDERGFAVVLAANGHSSSVIQDVTFRKNVVRRSAAGIGITGQTADFPKRLTQRVLIQDNLFEEIGGAEWGGSGVLFQIVGGTMDVVIDHNTGLQKGKALVTDGATQAGFVYQNNIALDHQTADALGYGEAWSVRFPGYVFARNVLTGGAASGYPSENFFPGSAADVGFVDAASGNYRLSAASPYTNAATDGANIGADYEALQSAAADAVTGGRNS